MGADGRDADYATPRALRPRRPPHNSAPAPRHALEPRRSPLQGRTAVVLFVQPALPEVTLPRGRLRSAPVLTKHRKFMHARDGAIFACRARMRISSIVLLAAVSIVACSEPYDEISRGDGDAPIDGTSFVASEATQRELGVERWQLRADGMEGWMTGFDGAGAERAAVHVRAVDEGGRRWVEIESATDTRASFRFRPSGGDAVEVENAASMSYARAAWRAAARADEDLRTASSGTSLTASVRPQGGLTASKVSLVNDMGSCLVFTGQVLGAIGSATGNDAISACAAACGHAGQAMSCYNNYK